MELTSAYILHHRPYRETSLLAELFSRDHGRVSVIMRGTRGPKSKNAAIAQPFIPLITAWTGKSDLKTLIHLEAEALPIVLTKQALWCGFYVNELIQRAVALADPYPSLYDHYVLTLQNLSQSVNMHSTLRLFEKFLLTELGYALPLSHDVAGQPIDAAARYEYRLNAGFNRIEVALPTSFIGESIIALQQDQLQQRQHWQDAKRLLQYALTTLIGSKPLKSKELFKELL